MFRESRAGLLLTLSVAALACAVSGCGTTRTSNTQRTATEQLLVSDAIDRAVQSIDFSPLAGQEVYFDDRPLYEVVDDAYLIGSLRQHMLATGCILKDDREAAKFIVEPRAGAVGTDNHDLLFGVPATNVPQFTLLAGLPPAIPEIPIAKRRNQRGVAKIAVFAYRRETGEPAWQSGIATRQSTANDIWVLGAGPFKRGTIHDGTSFAGDKLALVGDDESEQAKNRVATLGQQAVFQRVPAAKADDSQPRPAEVELAAQESSAQGDRPSAEVPAEPAARAEGPPVLPPPVQSASFAEQTESPQ